MRKQARADAQAYSLRFAVAGFDRLIGCAPPAPTPEPAAERPTSGDDAKTVLNQKLGGARRNDAMAKAIEKRLLEPES